MTEICRSLDLDAFIENIENRVKDTVGYMEAENKISYLVGVNTAATFAWEAVSQLRKDVARKNGECDVVLQDMGVLVRTLNKYQHLSDS